jgi:hypothetical protein
MRVQALPLRVEAEDRRAAARRPQQIQEHPDRRRLAGAVGAEEAEDLALGDVERQTLDANHRPEILRQRVEMNRGHTHVRTSGCVPARESAS